MNVCFRPEADIQPDPKTYILNGCFRESRHSRDYSLNPSLLRTSTNSGWKTLRHFSSETKLMVMGVLDG